jgi:triphosphoribosyl-dephospho-CoA synthase
VTKTDRDFVATAFIAACRDELEAPKPGNVHVFASGHRMEAQDFLESAEVSAGPLTAPGAGVGARIFGAVTATLARVKQNTNLGIVLLCAPLAHAALNFPQEPLEGALRRVLDALTREDATEAFKAIALANPAGLGKAPAHDVGGPAEATLLDAMRAATDRDRIACQYANGFSDVFGLGRAALAAARRDGANVEAATLRVYLAFLCAFPDSHILRKHGAPTAEAVLREARDFAQSLEGWRNVEEIRAAALAFDARLKQAGVNPGTSADLTVATLFTARLEDGHG